ncbi:MAG TPA: glucoamylase family protein [Ignavibacteriaceae bacterium]|nr:glucoamylase family protein [Ignavibacteriaceae bacterium]
MKKLIIIFLSLVTFSCSPQVETYKLSSEEEQFLDTLQYYTFKYFINEINPENGLVKDRSASYSPASIAATGFGVAAWIIGAEHNWITREEAKKYTLALVKFLNNSDQRGDTNSTGFKGLYYHFLRMDNGKREWKSELSTIDTGLLLAGLRAAYQYFNSNDADEKEIRRLVDIISNRIDWDWLTVKEQDAKEKKFVGSLSMGWLPDNKEFHDMGWIGYNEAMIMYVMAAGTGYKSAASAYQVWLDDYQWMEPYQGLAHIVFPPLFGHQYTQMFLDLRNYYDAYTRKRNIDYFENSRRATLTQRMYAIENPHKHKGYDSLTWGITACDGPNGYAGRGTSGPQFNYFDDGTIAPTAAGGSIPFAPEICIPTLMNIYNKYGKQGLWSKYGLTDAFNPSANWIDKDYIGIDQGPIVVMIENYRTGLIWKYMMKDPVVQKGLEILNFRKK